jgi:uncharacterized protein (DUF305 family)
MVFFATWAATIGALGGGKCAAANAVSDSAGATPAPNAARATPVPAGKPVSPADVAFMHGMIGHHAQALRMVALAPTHGASAKVLLLCKKIDISQHDEIATMTQWLQDHHQAVPDTSKPMAMAMPGMLTPAQMKQLDAARDTTFDRLFLTFMIQHHNGALEMVRQLFATNGAAQTPEVFQYATDVSVDQTGEIDRMQALLDSYPAPSSSRGSSPR